MSDSSKLNDAPEMRRILKYSASAAERFEERGAAAAGGGVLGGPERVPVAPAGSVAGARAR